jgi:hypothetical protein
VAARCASLHHRDLATRPHAGVLDSFTRSWILRASYLEKIQDVLRARRRPQRQQVMIRVGECPAAADRHEPWVSDRWQDHGSMVAPPSATWPAAPDRQTELGG